MLRAGICRHSSAMMLAQNAGLAGNDVAADGALNIGRHAAAEQLGHCPVMDVAQALMPERGRQQLRLLTGGQAELRSRV